MKFLNLPEFSSFNSKLTLKDCGDAILTAKLECYSLKRNKEMKQLAKQIENRCLTAIKNRSKRRLSQASPVGDLKIAQNRHRFADFILMLNLAFPDFDFVDLTPSHFVRHTSIAQVFKTITSQIHEIFPSFNTESMLKIPLQKSIDLNSVEIFSYINEEDDPLFESSIWSFNYIFYSKSNKRLAFLWAECSPKTMTSTSFSNLSSNSSKYSSFITPQNSDSDDEMSLSQSKDIPEQFSDDEDDTILPMEEAAPFV